MEFNNFVLYLLEVQLQFKVCHWQTKNHARHIAFGDAYEDLDGHIDDMVECWMGKYGKMLIPEGKGVCTLQNITSLNLTNTMKELREQLVNLDSIVNESDKDILAIRDNMLIITNKLAYLLSLG